METLNVSEISTIDVEQLKNRIKEDRQLLKAVTPVKQVTQTTLDRRSLNTMVKNDLMSFSQVYKFIRQSVLLLPNKITENSIKECEDVNGKKLQRTIQSVLFIYASDKLKTELTEAKKEFNVLRLCKLLTNINDFAKVCLTPNQFIAFINGNKSYNGTFIIDGLLKGCTMNPKLYGELIKKS